MGQFDAFLVISEKWDLGVDECDTSFYVDTKSATWRDTAVPRELLGHRNLDHLSPFSIPREEKPPRAGRFSMRGKKKNHHSHHLPLNFNKIKVRLQFGKAAVNNSLVQVAPGLASSPTAPSTTDLLPEGTRLMGLTEHISPHPPDACSYLETPEVCLCTELAGGTPIKQDLLQSSRKQSLIAIHTHLLLGQYKQRTVSVKNLLPTNAHRKPNVQSTREHVASPDSAWS